MNRLILLLILVSSGIQLASSIIKFENLFYDYYWGDDCTEQEIKKNKEYDPSMCVPYQIAVDGDEQIIVTVPRFFSTTGVPSTLNTVQLKHGTEKTGILHPYPDWRSNRMGDCAVIQNAISAQIDPNTFFLWIVDAGTVALLTDQPVNLCPPKLLVLDTRAGGKIIRSHEIPENIAPRNTSYLSDLALDYVDSIKRDGGPKYVYITDVTNKRIVVFNLITNKYWTHQHQESMGGEDSITKINGVEYTLPGGVKTLALSTSCDYLYYSTVSSGDIWQVETSVLRDPYGNLATSVRRLGPLGFHFNIMQFGYKGLYLSFMERCSLTRWNERSDTKNQGVSEGNVTIQTFTYLAQNYENMQGITGIAFPASNTEEIYYLSSKFDKAANGTLDFSGFDGLNFRIYKLNVSDFNSLLPPNAP